MKKLVLIVCVLLVAGLVMAYWYFSDRGRFRGSRAILQWTIKSRDSVIAEVIRLDQWKDPKWQTYILVLRQGGNRALASQPCLPS